MTRTDRRRGERGTTLLEVIIATAVLIIGVVAFAATANVAASSTRISHRTTTLGFIRSGVVDRVAVMPRAVLGTLPGATWVVDRCFDVNAREVGRNGDPTWSATYACPAGTLYQSWLNSTANAGGASWTVATYVERTDSGCTAAARHSSVGCIAADLLVTD
jgi:Tfp pilus assembly protein PilV